MKVRRPKRPSCRIGCLLFATALLALLSPSPSHGQIYRLPPPDTTAGNFFGVAVSIDGDRALVGASGENGCGENSGAAYVFERDPVTDTWDFAARLHASDCAEGDFFGRSLSLSGNRALIAAAETFFSTHASNAAYVFERDPETGTWQEVAKLTGDPRIEEGAFATSVSLDGDRALITTSGDPSEGRYGGSAYLYERDLKTGVWKRTVRLAGSEGIQGGIFGGTGVLDGDRAVVAASAYFRPGPGSVYIFERDPKSGTWRETQRFGKIDDIFISLALDGDRLLIGESKDGPKKSGLATLYTYDPQGGWRHSETFRPHHPYEYGAFGTLVSLQEDHTLIVGYDEQLGLNFNADRVVYVFSHDSETGRWHQQRIIDIGEADFATAVDQDGARALIGQASEGRPGAAYIVRLP